MAEIDLRLQIEGQESLKEDYQSVMAEIVEKIKYAAYTAQAEATEKLEEHIVEDVYKEWNPRVYTRRSDDESRSLGEPLTSVRYMDVTEPEEATDGHGNHLISTTLDYTPSGEHVVEKWHTADGDELIGRIEHKRPRYTYNAANRYVPPRPFWQLFVFDMVENGGYAKLLKKAFATTGELDIEIGNDDIQLEPQDGEY